MGKSFVTGIDIGHHSIKAVVLKSAGEQFELVSYKEIPVSEGIFAENHTFSHQGIVKKLKELKKQLPLMSRQVALALPDNAVISKLLHIDGDLEDREKEFAIYQVFGQQSPFPIEDLSLDYVKVEQDSLKRGTTATYQVYATRKEVVESRVEVIKKSGFKPVVIDLQAHSLLRVWQLAAQQQEDKQAWMMVDIGQSQTSICIIPQGRPAYYKDLPYGMSNMPEATQKLDLNVVEFEHGESVIDLGKAQDSGIDHHEDEFIAELADRLTRQMSLYGSVNQQTKIEGLWLTGGGACISGITEALTQQLQIPVEVLNPFQLLESKKNKKVSNLAPCTFSVAAGLAIRGLQWQRRIHVA
ncbi:type IV pilus assembly protein PilM [Vibrio algicola]|uniref:Type IV pilus assembly protein PilM n=1 Tax=Vibrio algicola TaxID=2662262 RepID=A0A5Q0TDH5_9VIBR|nr:type IV pilus assembly protein PilM [Vibrio algicola]